MPFVTGITDWDIARNAPPHILFFNADDEPDNPLPIHIPHFPSPVPSPSPALKYRMMSANSEDMLTYVVSKQLASVGGQWKDLFRKLMNSKYTNDDIESMYYTCNSMYRNYDIDDECLCPSLLVPTCLYPVSPPFLPVSSSSISVSTPSLSVSTMFLPSLLISTPTLPVSPPSLPRLSLSPLSFRPFFPIST